MSTRPTFIEEILNLLHAAHGNPLSNCIQCGTCSGTCPVAPYMDQSPRRIIAMINRGLKDQVLATNTFWYCASCYQCTVRCPSDIDIAQVMYALKRYSIWHNQYKDGLIGPSFSETFAKTIMQIGRSFEPVLAPTYLFSYGLQEFLDEAQTATSLIMKGRIPLVPPRIKRLANFRKVVHRIIPIGGAE